MLNIPCKLKVEIDITFEERCYLIYNRNSVRFQEMSQETRSIVAWEEVLGTVRLRNAAQSYIKEVLRISPLNTLPS